MGHWRVKHVWHYQRQALQETPHWFIISQSTKEGEVNGTANLKGINNAEREKHTCIFFNNNGI